MAASRCRNHHRAMLRMATGAVRRHGFTLIEVLVVIAVIGLIVVLLLPAAQAGAWITTNENVAVLS